MKRWINKFRKLKTENNRDVILSHTDYIHFMEPEGISYIDKYTTKGKSAIENALVTLCKLNNDILVIESCVFLYFNISSHYEVDDIIKQMNTVYDTCHEESDIAFDNKLEKELVKVVMILTSV